MHSNRDLIGYGRLPPNPKWPNGARLALNFVVNYEEGSEYSIGDGDERTDTGLTERVSAAAPVGQRDLAAESMFEYGSRVGIWRLFRIFQERRMPFTVFACALALERNPQVAQAIREEGLDFVSHGWRWVQHFKLTEVEEREHIRMAVASLEQTLGRRPLGWYCRYGPSENTRRLLVEEGGFLYDSDTYNDELPYWVRVNDKPHLVIPYTLTNNDSKFASGDFSKAADFYDFMKDAFDLLHDEGATAPKMMSVGLHARMIGHPARAAGLARFLDYVRGFDDVWLCGRDDIARHWVENHPPTVA